MRHTLVRENDPTRGVSVSTLAREYSRGCHVSLHAHGSDQLIYASLGVMEVASGQDLWITPPHCGLWIPARTPHHIRMPERVSMRTLYLRPALRRAAPECKVLHIGPLLRELIFEIVRVGRLRYRDRIECALRDLLVVELQRASPVPTAVRYRLTTGRSRWRGPSSPILRTTTRCTRCAHLPGSASGPCRESFSARLAPTSSAGEDRSA